jgi:molecular chaperone DnaJ/curved DNA-binding protein
VCERLSILGSPEGIRPSYAALRERFARNFTHLGVPKSEQLEALNVEVLLTREEAARGCIVPVGVPVFTSCPHCAGTGRDWIFPCAYCLQQGVVEGEACVRVRIPPMAPQGSTYELPLQGLGIHNFFLRLHVFVED